MNILNITKRVEVNYYVETDGDYPMYRRSEDGDWENLMGESWEPVYMKFKIDILENLFNVFLNIKD